MKPFLLLYPSYVSLPSMSLPFSVLSLLCTCAYLPRSSALILTGPPDLPIWALAAAPVARLLIVSTRPYHKRRMCQKRGDRLYVVKGGLPKRGGDLWCTCETSRPAKTVWNVLRGRVRISRLPVTSIGTSWHWLGLGVASTYTGKVVHCS